MSVRAASKADLAVVSLLFLLITFAFADVLFLGNVLFSRDLTFYYYPMKHVLRDVLLSHHLPFWNRLVAAGQPLAANPDYEAFYPLSWLVLLPDYVQAFHLHILVHLYVAAAGMFFLLRFVRCSAPAAFIGALSYSSGGLLISLLDMIPCLFALCWLPWILLFVGRYLCSGSCRDFALGALALAMPALIGEPVTLVQIWLVTGVFALWWGTRVAGATLRRAATVAAGVGAFSLLIGAVQIAPAADLMRDTVRSRPFPFALVSQWSFPPARLVEFFFPRAGIHLADSGMLVYGSWYGRESVPFVGSIYGGLLLAIAFTAGVLLRRRGWLISLGVVVGSMLMALGAHTPLLRLLYDARLFSSFRYPEKFVMAPCFALALFGAVSFDAVVRRDRRMTRVVELLGVIAASVALVAAIATSPERFGVWWGSTDPVRNEVLSRVARHDWLIATGVALAFAVAVELHHRTRQRWTVLLLCALVAGDLAMSTAHLAPRRPAEFFDRPSRMAQPLPNAERGRVLHAAANSRMVDPTQIRLGAMDRYWVMRNGFYPFLPARWNVATVLEYDYDQTHLVWTEELSDAFRRAPPELQPRFAAMSNVLAVVTPRDEEKALRAAGDIERIDPVDVVPVPSLPRYYFAEQMTAIRSASELSTAMKSLPAATAFVPFPAYRPGRGRVESVIETPNSVNLIVRAEQKGFLVASVTWHRYWRAFIDGAEERVWRTNVAYQGIVVPPGRHEVRIVYSNPVVIWSGVISLIAACAAITLLFSKKTADRAVRHDH